MRTGMIALSAPDGSTLVAWTYDGQTGWQLYDVEGRTFGFAGFREEFRQRRCRSRGQGWPLHPLPVGPGPAVESESAA